MSPSPLPLAGLKIVSLALNLPGPVAAGRLRDLGADITKIEPPDGDPLAGGCLPWYQALHQNVMVVRMDISEPANRERLDALLEKADLLLTSSRPAALDRLGLSGAELRARHPRLCHVAIIGQLPPEENKPGHDLTYQASLGLLSPPELPKALVADLAGALAAIAAAMALLLARQRGQEASSTWVSLAESARLFALPHDYGLTLPDGLLGGAWPGYNFYKASRGWVAVAALEPHFAERLVRELGVESLTRDSLADAFRGRSADEWEEWAAGRDLPIVAVRDADD